MSVSTIVKKVQFDTLDEAVNAMQRVAGAFAPHAQESPDMSIKVDKGQLFDASGPTLTEVAAQNTAVITKPTTNPRIDRIVVDNSTGVVSVITGAEAATPIPPAITSDKLPIAQVYLTTTTTQIANQDITDERVIGLSKASSGTVTSVGSGTGLTGGPITTSGTLNVDVGTTANKIVQLDASAKLPAVDGSLLTNLPGGTVTSVGSGTGLTGGPITASGTLNVDVGTGANQIVQLDASAKLPAVDGSLLTNLPEGNQFNSNILLNSYRIAENGGNQVMKMIDGVVDAFVTETGVNGSASTNETYDGANDLYIPTNSGGTIPMVKFDGTNDYLNRGAGLTGIADGKTGTVSFWYRPTTVSGSQWILTSTNDNLYLRQSSAHFELTLRNSTGTYIFTITSSNDLVVGELVHVFVSWDLGNAKGNIYINGVDKENSLTITNDDIDYTVSNWQIGNRVLLSDISEFEIGQLWFNTEYVEPTTDINEFYDDGPVSLGSDGSTPTGNQPILFLNNSLATWENNLGTGGNFTEVGGLADAGTLDASFDNMTLISESQTATTQPDEANVLLLAEGLYSNPIPNTEIKAFVSRNNGTTYTEVTLSDVGEFEKGRLLSGVVDISSQSSGTNMKWKVETLDNKALNLHGVGLEWR